MWAFGPVGEKNNAKTLNEEKQGLKHVFGISCNSLYIFTVTCIL